MFSLAKEILEAKARGEEWDWEDFEAVMELMEEEVITLDSAANEERCNRKIGGQP